MADKQWKKNSPAGSVEAGLHSAATSVISVIPLTLTQTPLGRNATEALMACNLNSSNERPTWQWDIHQYQ